jgi:Domain of unknown function (DUF4271)
LQKNLNIKRLLILLLLVLPVVLFSQLPDTVFIKKDSVQQNQSVLTPYQSLLQKLIDDNQYLSSQKTPVLNIISYKKNENTAFPFYIMLGIVCFLAIIKFLYSRYFITLFKVFLNTSLKQSQLTDQLLQAKLPSLLYNILFVTVSGIYIYTLLNYYGLKTNYNDSILIGLSILAITIIYLCKYSSLKLTGWVTGNIEVTNSYAFIIFLINKIIGITLIPLLIIISFAKPDIAYAAVISSFLLIAFMFLLRFFRSYGALQHKLKISRFHFFIYIIGVEVLPLLVCYKALALFLSKNT